MAAQPHSHEHIHTGEHDHEGTAMTPYDVKDVARSYIPVRLVCLGIAVFFGVIGAIALTRTGIGFDTTNDFKQPATSVFGMSMTPLLALILAGIAVISLMSATIGRMARAWMMLLGPLMLAAGMVVLARPGILGDWLAMNRTDGVAFLVAGGAGVATVIGTPITWSRRDRSYRRDMVTT